MHISLARFSIVFSNEWHPLPLQAFKARVSHIPTISKFLQAGSQRKPPLDEDSIKTVKNIFKFERGLFLKNMATIVAEY